MITTEMLKQRINDLIDEVRRIEGAIREARHLVSVIELQNQKIEVESVEQLK